MYNKWYILGSSHSWQCGIVCMSIFAALSCRAKVLTRLSKEFRDPAEALKFLESPRESRFLSLSLHQQDASTQADFCSDDVTAHMLALLSTAPEREKAQVVCKLMQALAAPSSARVPTEFIAQSLLAMQRLQEAGRSNVLALLAKSLGTMRPDGVESLMPICRMPLGLIEYAVNFFASTKVPSLCMHIKHG